MSPFREQPMDLAYQPPAYPQPDWEKGRCTAVHAYLPDDVEVGWLVLSGDALAWVATAAPATLAASLSQWVRAELQRQAMAGTPATTAWTELLGHLLHTPPEEMACAAVLAFAM